MTVEQAPILQRWDVIRDTYTVTDYLGRGAFGQVYKVRHKFLNMQAIKVFDPKIFGPDSESDLLMEAVVLQKLTHKNVVRVFEANSFEKNGHRYVFIAMELVNGGSLDKVCLGDKKIDLKTTLKLCRDILLGLEQAHSQKPSMVHRDIKPQNILIERRDSNYLAKVSDFGLARHVNPETSLINAEGTLAFMAPEGFWDYETPASDVFSAGIVMYWMITGQFPFHIPPHEHGYNRENLKNVLIETRRKKPLLPSQLNTEIDPGIDQIIFKSIDFDIKKRFQTAGEFEKAMNSFLQIKDDCSKDQEEARKLVTEALTLGRQYSTLPEAVLKMETAFAKDAGLIPKYTKIADQWRRGILM